MKAIIYPEDVSEELVSVNFKHPKTGEDHLYFCDTKSGRFYELVKYCDQLSSWFIDDYVVEDGSLLLMTPIDVTYLVLPYFIKSGTKFFSLDDALINEQSSSLDAGKVRISLRTLKPDFSMIANHKDIDGENYYKYDESKTLCWLKTKVEATLAKLKEIGLTVSSTGSKAKGFKSGRENKEQDEDELLEKACELIGNYLPDNLYKALRTSFKLKDISAASKGDAKPKEDQTSKRKNESDQQEVIEVESSPKRKKSISEVKANGKAEVAVPPKEEVTKPAIALTRSQKQLQKVNTKGMKSLSSYFTAKPKA